MIVVALGTSLTETGGWLQPLGRVMAKRSGRPVTVHNFGKSGANSSWGVTQVGRIVVTRPDIVLVEFSVNDAAWLKGIALSQSRKNIEEIVGRIRAEHPRVELYLMTMNPVSGLRRWIRLSLNSYYDLYRELAKELGVSHIDHRPSWNTLTGPQLATAIPDGLHPTPEMAVRVMVPTIARAIANAG
jgi:lysophospholipase L1-like esterase